MAPANGFQPSTRYLLSTSWLNSMPCPGRGGSDDGSVEDLRFLLPQVGGPGKGPLDQQRIRNGRHDVDRKLRGEMRRYFDVVGRRQVGNLDHFTETAAALNIGIEDGRGPLIDEISEAVAGVLVFPLLRREC